MGLISQRYAQIGLAHTSMWMPYTVTFYALRPGLDELPVTIHRVERDLLSAYTGAPGMALAAAQSVGREPRADGFRVVCPAGKVLLDYVGRVGRG